MPIFSLEGAHLPCFEIQQIHQSMKITQPTWGEMHSTWGSHGLTMWGQCPKSTTHKVTSLMVVMHNIFQPRGSLPWPWNMSIILCGPLKQIGNILLLFIHSGRTWKFGWHYTPHYAHALLFIILGTSKGNIVDLETIHMKHVHPNIIPF